MGGGGGGGRLEDERGRRVSGRGGGRAGPTDMRCDESSGGDTACDADAA